MKKSSRAFTLIELLVVISIIGLLASVIMVSLNGARDKAKVARAKADAKQVGTAIEMYYDANNTCPYPTHDFDGVANPATNLKNAMSGFVATIPAADPWGVPWRYHCHPAGGTSGECTCFFSSGPDKAMTSWPWNNCTFSGDDIGWCQGQPGNLGY